VALGALPSFHKVLARRFAAGASAGVHLVRVDVARSDVLTILGATGLLAGVPMAMNALIGLHEMLATRLTALSKAAVVGGTCTHATTAAAHAPTHGHTATTHPHAAAAQHHTALRRLIVHSTRQRGLLVHAASLLQRRLLAHATLLLVLRLGAHPGASHTHGLSPVGTSRSTWIATLLWRGLLRITALLGIGSLLRLALVARLRRIATLLWWVATLLRLSLGRVASLLWLALRWRLLLSWRRWRCLLLNRRDSSGCRRSSVSPNRSLVDDIHLADNFDLLYDVAIDAAHVPAVALKTLGDTEAT
jgi:hypothetical protein